MHVSLVCRSNYKQVHAHGVALSTRDYGDYHFTPAHVYPSIHAAGAGAGAGAGVEWDYVVVTTKALPDVVDDAATIRPVVTPGRTAIVLIQNGVGIEEPHRAAYPRNPLISAVTVVSAEQTSPGSVRQNRWTRISLGPYTHGGGDGDGQAQLASEGEARTAEFVRLLREGGVKDAEAYDETGLQLVRWHKICINGSMNPSAVLAGRTGNARMALDPHLRIHLHACMMEVFNAVPRVLGRPFPDSLATPDRILKSTERNTGAKPSMLLDWIAGRPMELEVILGNPVRIAQRHGVDMPRLQSLYALLKMAQTRRDEDKKQEQNQKEKEMTKAKL